MPFVIKNKISGLVGGGEAYKKLVYSDKFLIDEGDFSTGELFAIDSTGVLTQNVNNLKKGDYLPYSSLFEEKEGFTFHRFRFIAWEKYKGYTIIYRKYFSEIVQDEIISFIVLWISFWAMYALIIISRKKTKEETINDIGDERIENRIEKKILDTVFEGFPDGVIIGDDKGNIVKANKTFAEIMGYTPNELKGMAMEVFLPKGKKPEHRTNYQDHIHKGNNVKRRIVKAIKKDGSEIDIKLSVSSSNIVYGRSYPIATIKKVET